MDAESLEQENAEMRSRLQLALIAYEKLMDYLGRNILNFQFEKMQDYLDEIGKQLYPPFEL
jgi:uncharacterized protein with von Willebrand factor type A (vWA) domain